MSTQKPRLHFRYLIFAIIIAIIVVMLSLILYPEWTASLRALLGLLAAVVTVVLATVANIRQIIEPSLADKPAAPLPSIQTKEQSGSVSISEGTASIQGDLVGRDKIIAGEVIGRDKITQIIQPPPPAVQALHSLPPPPADFTGRAAEADQLLQRLGEGTGAAISGVSGMGGIGKTALALFVAHKLAKQYPEAQIYVELKGTTTRLSPTEAMVQVIHAFQPLADLRQATPDEIEALYRSLLDGKQALLLLDNAEDATQVKPLLPPSTCGVVVTSRRTFVLPGLQPLRLDVLNPDDARDLLLSICPRLDAHAGRLAELCGHLPLALRIAASHLAARVNLAPSDYIAQLEAHRLARLVSEDDPEQNVERVLDLSYGQLAPEMQARFRTLAVFPAPFDSLAAAAVWALEPGATRDLLGELVRFSLVEYDASPSPFEGEGRGEGNEGRYGLHDLLRDFADARLTPDERHTAQQRHAESYLNLCWTMDRLYKQGGDNVLSALALFDAEFPHIRAGQAWSVSLAPTNDAAARLCNYYPDAAPDILALRLHRREWIHWLQSALATARKLGNKQAEGRHLGNLGLAHRSLGEVRQAIDYFERALAIAREIGDRRGEGYRLGNLGLAYVALGEVRQAIDYFEQSLAIAREIGDRKSEGNALGNLGIAYAILGEVQNAIEYYGQALAIQHAIGDRQGEENQLGNLGNAYYSRGEVQKAIEHYEQALAIAREIGDRRNEATWLGNLGNAYRQLGEVRKAIEYFEQALAIAREIGDRQAEGTNLFNLSFAYEKLDDLPTAITCAESALKIFEAIESPHAERARRQLESLREKSRPA
jgi:tetratricopeptide (TPR) repeat protein